jgi:hypothetical protein
MYCKIIKDVALEKIITYILMKIKKIWKNKMIN